MPSDTPTPVTIHADSSALAIAAANGILHSYERALEHAGTYALALLGGGTPRPLFEILSSPRFASAFDWSKVHVFWSDERAVPPDDPRSNFGMARARFLSRVPLPPANLHRLRGEINPDSAAREADDGIRRHFRTRRGAQVTDATLPAFDTILLGLGEDGHVASLFPGSPLLEIIPPEPGTRVALVAATREERSGTRRLTFTPALLAAATEVVILAAGGTKADVSSRLFRRIDPREGKGFLRHDVVEPAALVTRAARRVHWHLDAAAAAKVPGVTVP